MVAVAERKHAAGQRPGWAGEMTAMLDAYEQAGGDPKALQAPDIATLVVSGDQVLAVREIPGVRFEAKPLENGVQARILVEPGIKVERPIHLCFGVIPAEGVQEILADCEIGEGADAQFLAHCSFPNAVRVQHHMQARIHVGKNASLTYTEEHYHGKTGGIEVLPQAKVAIKDGGRFITTFSLTRGRVGKLALDYEVEVGAGAVTKMTTKVYGTGVDQVTVKEVVHLNGENARGLTRARADPHAGSCAR